MPSGTHITMPMHVDVPPFDNNDVRLAIKYSLDRDEALAKILKGHGTLGNDHPIGAVLPYYAQDLEQRIYDPDKAKHHLKKAGMENLKVSFSTSDVPLPGGVDLAILFQENAASLGHHDRRRARAERRLLVQCLAGQAILPGLLGPTADTRCDVLAGLRG